MPSVQLLVPLDTYTGWNEPAAGFARGGGCGFFGGLISFARTEAERRATGDPRSSLEVRYRDHAGFVARVKAVTAQQVSAGWLLADDARRLIAEAEASDVLRCGSCLRSHRRRRLSGVRCREGDARGKWCQPLLIPAQIGSTSYLWRTSFMAFPQKDVHGPQRLDCFDVAVFTLLDDRYQFFCESKTQGV